MSRDENKHTAWTRAMKFAKEKHKGQLDDTGKDYFDAHLMPVMQSVARIIPDRDVVIAAVLHDTLEDTDTTYEELVKEFGVTVADLVNEVTDEGEKDQYGKYFPRLKTKYGILIKLIDRASNISRMESWSDKRQEHYLKKTKFWKDGSDRISK